MYVFLICMDLPTARLWFVPAQNLSLTLRVKIKHPARHGKTTAGRRSWLHSWTDHFLPLQLKVKRQIAEASKFQTALEIEIDAVLLRNITAPRPSILPQ